MKYLIVFDLGTLTFWFRWFPIVGVLLYTVGCLAVAVRLTHLLWHQKYFQVFSNFSWGDEFSPSPFEDTVLEGEKWLFITVRSIICYDKAQISHMEKWCWTCNSFFFALKVAVTSKDPCNKNFKRLHVLFKKQQASCLSWAVSPPFPS
jgi:hypothetical protein